MVWKNERKCVNIYANRNLFFSINYKQIHDDVCRDILITSIGPEISYEDFCSEIKDICKFDDQQLFTVKWLDEEGLSISEGKKFDVQCFKNIWCVLRILIYMTIKSCFMNARPFSDTGDPCTISSQTELNEAIRLYDLNKDSELALHGMFSIYICQHFCSAYVYFKCFVFFTINFLLVEITSW